MAMQNLGSPMGLGFPISNYTMSAALLERIDFWDTVEDAIGEDFHMFVKAYFKTGGQVCGVRRPSFHKGVAARGHVPVCEAHGAWQGVVDRAELRSGTFEMSQIWVCGC